MNVNVSVFLKPRSKTLRDNSKVLRAFLFLQTLENY